MKTREREIEREKESAISGGKSTFSVYSTALNAHLLIVS